MRFAAGRIKIDNAKLGRKTAVLFYRTSAVEYLFFAVRCWYGHRLH
jgi:hypothetical protein